MLRRRSCLAFLARLLALSLVLLGVTGTAFADQAADAYVISAGASDRVLPRHAKAGSGYRIKFNERALEQAHVTFDLGGGLSRTAERTRAVANGQGRSWIGKFQGRTSGIVVLSKRQGVVSGILDDGEKLFELIPGPRGRALLFRVDATKLPPVAAPLMPDEYYPDESGGVPTFQASGIVHDVMLLYTAAVKNSYGSVAATEAALLDSMLATNQTYIDSEVDVQVNVVHIAEVTYEETGNMSTSLKDLRMTADGDMDEVHAWRNTYGADLVQLVTMDTDNCGIAYLMNNNNISYAPYGFSVTSRDCVSGTTPAHELGHNQGNCHNREEAGCDNPAYEYSYGLCGPDFRTIMSYSSPCGTARIRRFSNPNVYVDGQPTGIDHDLDPVNSADGSRTVNNTAATVAAYRSGPNATPPAAPSNLAAVASSETSITLQWTDNADDENGFRVERSLDNSSWSAVANLGADREVFSNGALSPGTIYHFRVRAFNGVGESAWANVSAETPGSYQQSPDAPVAPSNLRATEVTATNVRLAWDDNADNEGGFTIERNSDGSNAYPWSDNVGPGIESFTDQSVSAQTLYYYRVSAFNEAGSSEATGAIAVETPAGGVDADADGVDDAIDNCLGLANADQRDTDQDGYGNLCDADLDNNGIINFEDLSLFRSAFSTGDPDADFDGDGVVNFGDLARFRQLFGESLGPSALVP